MTIMITLRLTDHPRVHAVLVSASWLLMSVFIGIYAMQLGGVANLMIK
jgi:hypothetical protein